MAHTGIDWSQSRTVIGANCCSRHSRHCCLQTKSECHSRVDKPLLKGLTVNDRGRAVVPQVKSTRCGSTVAARCSAVAVTGREPRGLLLHVIVVRALWRFEVGVALGRVPRTDGLEVDEPWRVPKRRTQHACMYEKYM